MKRIKALELSLIIITVLLLNVSGGVVSKYIALNLRSPWLLLLLLSGLALIYLLRMLFWLVIGKKYKLSFIYPFISLNYLLAFSLGIILFNEPFVLRRLLASMIIIAGVVIISRSPDKYEVLI